MLLSGRGVAFGHLLTMKLGAYFTFTMFINGFVASIFFDFFKVFLAILFPPRLICPHGHRSLHMQSNRQTSPSLRSPATHSIDDTSLSSRSTPFLQLRRAALN